MAETYGMVDRVQYMDFNELCDILDDLEVDYSALENIEDLRDLVVQSVTHWNSSDTTSQSQEQASCDIMGRILAQDAERKSVISDIYDSILAMLRMKQFEKNLSSELKKEYDDYIGLVQHFKEKIERRHCPIVVAGETGAGKSSLLNLIMGQHVLPHHVLSSTSTICQIINSDTKKAVIIDMNDKQIHLHDVTETTLSQFTSVDRSGKNTENYKRVDIYWPLPMLKEYATIVDTPGVGESNDMTNVLIDYLSEAVAFIYVINTANAGGVQDDRLVKIFKEQRELERKGLLWEFDPESAIFVCNKWDKVPAEEESKVWEYIDQKLTASWPTRRNVQITNQMFKMSVAEDLRRRQTGLGYTEKFRSLISGIDRLISTSLESRVKGHVEWQHTFLNRILIKIVAKINSSNKNQAEKMALKAEVQKRLKTIEHEIKGMKKDMEEKAILECQLIADELSNHLNSCQTKSKMFRWSSEELPTGNDFGIIQHKAKQLITDKIQTEIVQWYQKRHINERFYKLLDPFSEKFKFIKDNYNEINKIIQGFKPPTVDRLYLSRETENSSDYDACEPYPTLFDKLKMYISDILWAATPKSCRMPLAISLVLMKEIIQFKMNKTTDMLILAEEEMKNYSSKAIYEGLSQTFLKEFMSDLEHVCDNIITKQIKADQELIENIVKEDRDYQTLKQEYKPIEKNCKQIIGHLLHAKLTLLSKKPSIKREGFELGRGSYSTVYLCDAQLDGREIQCAVKKVTQPLRHKECEQLTEAVNLRTFCHPNIVRCFGISLEKTPNEKEYLNIFMELCECSLEDIMICDRHPMEMCQCSQQRRQTCHVFPEKARNQQGYVEAWGFYMQTLKGVVSGLDYLHEEGFVHRDIKLSNILVKDNLAKIADIGLTKHEDLLQGTIIGTPVFMAPEVFKGRMYGRSADIFSLAIMMWEMWYGRRVFSESIYSDVITSYNSIKEHVIGGGRPKFSVRTPPPEEIQTLMEECWKEIADDRPMARQLTTRLRDISVNLSP